MARRKKPDDGARGMLPFFFAGTSERAARRASSRERAAAGRAPPARPRKPLLTPEQDAIKDRFVLQCAYCNKVKHPRFTPNPGHILTNEETGKMVSHTECPDCKRKRQQAEADRRGITLAEYRRRVREAKTPPPPPDGGGSEGQ